ncbi:MAG TPA: sigma-70 family RNA polymerase sigma factor [Candidatus Sulfotelmatobacter sp.]|nr:sigma-70 family RNA polymerase sigma factor [Candidatus Sulfotelmatobacter sp.]
MPAENRAREFEREVLPHLDASYNLARWMMRNDQDAEDVVQEAYLRAFRFFGTFRGGNSRAWLLMIVRNTIYSWMRHNRPHESDMQFDETLFGADPDAPNPEDLVVQSCNGKLLRQALESLPVALREVLVLRELEEMSYADIAQVTGLCAGTVMSRLSRARSRLRQCLSIQAKNCDPPGVRENASYPSLPIPGNY